MADNKPVQQQDTPLNIEKLVQTLQHYGVSYMLIGGLASVAYGATRMTWDIDLLPQLQKDNLDNLTSALNHLDARLRTGDIPQQPFPLEAASFKRTQIMQLRTSVGDIDILQNMLMEDFHRATYEELHPNASEIDAFGVTIEIVGLEDIIASKKAANRPKDRLDIAELEKILELRAQTKPES